MNDAPSPLSPVPNPILAANLARVRERIAAAAQRTGRRTEDVRLVAVTKYVSPEIARALAAAGCRDLGESRPQELWRKAEALADLDLRWHMIGHLQRNKVERTLPHVALLHSVDSPRLLQAVENSGRALGRSTPALLEVNVSRDPAKHGFAPEEVTPLLDTLRRLRHVDVLGLMAMAGEEGDLAAARRDFRALRELRNQLRDRWQGRYALDELSMGMSGDYEAAIEEGSTIVRIGSALFEQLMD